MTGPTELQRHEAVIQLHPEAYRVSAFRGRGEYAKAEVPTFERAFTLARQFYSDRPVAVYAVRGNTHSHVLNVEPRKELHMAYLVQYDSILASPGLVTITRYVTLPMAQEALKEVDVSDPATLAYACDSPEGVVGSGPQLVRLYNYLHTLEDSTVTERFATRADGQRRLFARIEARAAGQPVLSVPVPPSTEPPLNDDKEAPVAKAKVKRTGKRGFAPDAKITILVDENPKRKGSASHDRFALYKNNLLVSTFLEKGGTSADLAYDVAHKYIAVK